MMGTLILWLAAAAYGVSAILAQRTLAAAEGQSWAKVTRGMQAGFALHTAGLVIWGLELGRCPVTTLTESLSVYSWGLTLIYLVLAPRWRIEVLGTFCAPTALLLLAASLALTTRTGQPPAPLPSGFISLHVTALVLGYGAVTLATGAAVLYFIQSALLKRKTVSGLLHKLPSLQQLDAACYRLVMIGFPLIVLGLVTGAVYAQYTPGVAWTWGPKEIVAVAASLLYALYLHARMVAGWQGRRVNLLLIAAFIGLVITYAGLGILPGAQHRF